MVIKLKCKSCGYIIAYDLRAERGTYLECSNCGHFISGNDEAKLYGIGDMQDFEVIGIEQNFTNKILADDLSGIEKVFDNANPDNQEIIVNIIDKLYLMLNRGDEVTLKEIEEMLRKYFWDSCNEANAQFEKELLGENENGQA